MLPRQVSPSGRLGRDHATAWYARTAPAGGLHAATHLAGPPGEGPGHEQAAGDLLVPGHAPHLRLELDHQGGQKEKLAEQMGHSNTVVTDRYTHFRPDLYREEDYRVLAVDLNAGCGKVLPMRQPHEKGADCRRRSYADHREHRSCYRNRLISLVCAHSSIG